MIQVQCYLYRSDKKESINYLLDFLKKIKNNKREHTSIVTTKKFFIEIENNLLHS